MKSEQYKYISFSLSLFLLQMAGYNVVTIGILALSLTPVSSINEFINRIRVVPFFFVFLLSSILIGLYYALTNGMYSWNVMYWGQFYFFCFILLSIRDKEKALSVLKYCVYAIFIADIFTNILLLIGFNLPWSELPPVRIGETMSRYTGVKGNTLYSGSITFLAICFLLQEKNINKIWKSVVFFFMVFNLILSGSYRYFIVFAVVITLTMFRLYKHIYLLILMYVVSIILVYFSTKFTAFINLSNFERYYIWQHFFGEISKEPLFGHGYFNIHLVEYETWTFRSLISNGVTESCILLIAYCFGIPSLILFLSSIGKTLWSYKAYTEYHYELGIFIGFTLDLFWGGSFDNSLTLSAMLLSFYLINIRHYEREFFNNTSYIQQSRTCQTGN